MSKVSLDKSWEKYFLSNCVDRSDASSQEGGARIFQQKAIEALEEQVNETSNLGDYNKGIIRGLNRAIKIIKNLKA